MGQLPFFETPKPIASAFSPDAEIVLFQGDVRWKKAPRQRLFEEAEDCT
jgi:hypothetical protein